ncbi:uncharacterized protein [Miscanthus floridulus]|uniref:uncharacterized protein n=1 Tax=Miscanthus floridulus TaxID=154761 RepID=UPI00345B3EC2
MASEAAACLVDAVVARVAAVARSVAPRILRSTSSRSNGSVEKRMETSDKLSTQCPSFLAVLMRVKTSAIMASSRPTPPRCGRSWPELARAVLSVSADHARAASAYVGRLCGGSGAGAKGREEGVWVAAGDGGGPRA